MTNRLIATRRGCSLDAVKSHIENVRAKLDLKDRAAIRAWDGLPERHRMRRKQMSTIETTVRLGHIGQTAHYVKDIDTAVPFFRDTLGMTHLFTAGKLAFFDCDGTRFMVDAMEEAQGRGNSVHYFSVADIHASTEALRAKGVKFESEPHLIHRHPDGTEEWMSFFATPDGALLALMSAVRPE